MIKREYSDCELGPKCPNKQSFITKSTGKYKNKVLLSNLDEFPIRDLQNAINGFLSEIGCSTENQTHHGKRTMGYDLNFYHLHVCLLSL